MSNKHSAKVAVALPYAVSIRDFVHSGALAALVRLPGLKVKVYTINPDLPELDEVRECGAEIVVLLPYEDSTAEALFKRIYPQLFADTFTYLGFVSEGSLLRQGLAWSLSRARRLLGVRNAMHLVELLLSLLFRARRLPRQLDDDIDLFIGTRSLLNSIDYGLLAEANCRSIKVVTVASSWDNFTTKGYFPFPARKVVVWNEKMRSELSDIFAISINDVVVAGYPRATALREGVRDITAEEYLQSISIAGFKRFVLYSASYGELTRAPRHEYPLEYLAVRQVCEALEPSLPADVCILVRLHPFSKDSDRAAFDCLPRCFVFVPGRADKYVERVMNHIDEQDLATQIAKAECVISLASTMSIDALCLGRPVLNLDLDPVGEVEAKWSPRRFYHFNHFRDLVKIAKLPLARSVPDVCDFVKKCLDGVHESVIDYSAFEAQYVPSLPKPYARIIVETIESELDGH
jgi:hypothetical protein